MYEINGETFVSNIARRRYTHKQHTDIIYKILNET